MMTQSTPPAKQWIYGEHTYHFYNVGKTWDQASSFATELGGYLVKVDDGAENSNIFSNISGLFGTSPDSVAPDGGSGTYVWLGASDAASEGNWVWVKDKSSLSISRAEWGAGDPGSGFTQEPDNSRGIQNYLGLGITRWPNFDGYGSIGTPGKWNDLSGGNQLYFIVEFDAASDTTAPSVITFSPVDDASGIAVSSNFVATFSEAIKRGTGNIVLKKADGTSVATYGQVSSEVVVSGNTLTINPASDLTYSTGYKVEFAAGSVQDLAGNNYAGTTTYNFTTGVVSDTTAPTVSNFSPADEATAVAIGANVVVTFSEAIKRGTGNIFLKKADGTSVATYGQVSSEVVVSGNTLTINPASDLTYSTGYKVEFAAGSVQDLAGNNYAGTTTYNFGTGAFTNSVPTGNVFIHLPARDLLVLDFEGDDGSSVFVAGITAINDALISTAQKITGNSSAYFNGRGAALQFNIPALNIGAGDFEIDFYFKTEGGQNPWSVIMSSLRDGGWGELSNGTARGGAILFANGGNASGTYVNDGVWHRLVAGQSGTESYLILDEALQAKVATTATSHDFSDLIVGKLGGVWIGNSDNSFRGWIDNLKISVPYQSLTQGQILTASNTLADADGIPTFGLGSISYLWKAGGVVIPSATASTYTLTQAEVGKTITVTASYTDLFGQAESVSSSATSAVLGIDSVAAPAKFWKGGNRAPSETNKAGAVNLTDAISILKMIVGLSVNANNAPLSPYQAVAADFDQSGSVDLTDAIGVLKMVVGLNAPAPTWKYFDDVKLASAYNATQPLNHKTWSAGAAMDATSTADSIVKFVGVLTGDVDGSWIG